MYCPNCGAEFSEAEASCPYCGQLNPRGAEKQHMEKLHDLHRNTGRLAEETTQELVSGVRQNGRKIALLMLVLLALVVAGLVLRAVIGHAYSVMDGDYGSLYDTTIRNTIDGSYKGEIPAYRNLAFYYEQAVLTHAYEENNDMQKAGVFRARMKDYEAKLGSLAGEAAKVRTRIGMDP